MKQQAFWPNMRRAVRRGPGRTRRSQRGQGLVEFSFFVLAMLFMVVGVTDIATLLDVHESIVYAARQGARTGAVIGPVANADCAIVGAIHSALLNQPNLTITNIYIYQATDPANGAGVDGSRGSAKYDQYPGTVDCDATGNIINTKTGTPQAPLAFNWDPSQRNNTPFSVPSTIDSVGVELDYTYQYQFNLLGTGSLSGLDYSVFQMNPSGLPTPIPTPTS